MLLRSFSFNKDVITEKELSLFEYLVEHPEYKCDVAYDILMNALEGKIDYSKEFNLKGYEITIKRNHLFNKGKRAKKVVSIDAPASTDTEDSMLDVLPNDSDFVTEFLDDDLYNRAVEYILNTKYYTINTKDSILLDIKYSLLKALQGIPDAVKLIKLACDTDSKFKDYIEVLLTRGINSTLVKQLERG